VTPLLRFAPSPTGRLHLGNIRTALVNWLYAHRQGGGLLLRIDDTDRERSLEAHAQAIEADLAWLGLSWDKLARQSDRFARYAEVVERLKAAGRLYPCFETPEELELKRKLQLSRGKPPIYDRAALNLSPEQIADYARQGVVPAWRFKLAPGSIRWDDLVRGATHFEAEHLSDPVLVRPDGVPVYMLASVVDDLDFAVTHVIRGEDHVANTALQIQLFQALGGAVPAFGHFALISDATGEKLSKRTGASSIEDLRLAGYEPMAILSLLAKLGTSDPIEARPDLATLVAEFDIAKFGRSRPKLDQAELDHLNAKLIHDMDYESVAGRLPAGAGPDFWAAVRGNLGKLAEAEDWWRVVTGPVAPVIAEADFAAAALDCLPEGAFDAGSWGQWTQAVKARTGRKGKELFLPLRLALTGLEHGPELARLLPLIGRDRAVRRLKGEAA
jgi:glutamyl-tRNA synthetase